MKELTQAQWHRIAAADELVNENGNIIGVIENGEVTLFNR